MYTRMTGKAQAANAGRTASASAPAPMTGPRVLVVDDEPGICAVFEELLPRYGCEVAAFTCGADAIDAARQRKFDFVFIDIIMPTMNGRHVLNGLQGLCPDATFVMITGYPDSELVGRCMDDGAFLCLAKPISVLEITELLQIAGADDSEGDSVR